MHSATIEQPLEDRGRLEAGRISRPNMWKSACYVGEMNKARRGNTISRKVIICKMMWHTWHSWHTCSVCKAFLYQEVCQVCQVCHTFFVSKMHPKRTSEFVMKKYGRFRERLRGTVPACQREDGAVTTNEHLKNGQRISNVWLLIASIFGVNYGDKGGQERGIFSPPNLAGKKRKCYV